jgi:anti-sigma regulatory factor (Ser/Thr protein kinase)
MIGAARPTLAMVLDHPTKVGEARRQAVVMAEQLDFDETRRGRVALVVTEAASNMIKHAGQGDLVVQGLTGSPLSAARLDVLAVDRGPGMNDVGRCLAGGYSTAGSLGAGLGAIARLSDGFAIHSLPGAGTALWARLDAGGAEHGVRPSLDLGVVSVAVAGEEACGDEWAMLDREGMGFILVVDGLGHGPAAAEAAAEAVAVFRDSSSSEPGEIVAATHAALRGTRGAAMAIARIDPRRGVVRFAGVGNIAGVILDEGSRRSVSMVSQNGTVGHAVRKIQEFEYAWAEDASLILHSDGLATRWDLDRYPGLSARNPGLVAGLLYRDHRRDRDDVTVIVATRGKTST